jgi:hypothetical protein
VALARYVVTADVAVPAGVASAQASGPPVVTTATTGAAPAALSTITSQALAAGTYLVGWTGQLSASAVAGDANNFALYSPTGTQLPPISVNAGAPGTYPQNGRVITIPSGGATLYVKNIGIGSATTTYTAWLTTTPLMSTAPGQFGTVGWTGAGYDQGWSAGMPVTFRKETIIELDSASGGGAALYAAIGAGNLRAFVQGQDDVGHLGITN